MKLALALMLLGSSALVAHNSDAAQAVAVASNGKWAVRAYDQKTDVKDVSAKAITTSGVSAKGGTDPKVVYSNWHNGHGAIAVSDGGTGKIVGWSIGIGGPRAQTRHGFMGDPTKTAEKAALADCQKKRRNESKGRQFSGEQTRLLAQK